MKIQDILNEVRTNGMIVEFSVTDASKVFANSIGKLWINPTIFRQKFVQKEFGDEIVKFYNKQTNISELERQLNRFVGLEIRFFTGIKSFYGKLEN